MAENLHLKLRMTLDGKEAQASLELSREQFRKLAIDARLAGESMAGGFGKASEGVRSISAMLDRTRNLLVGVFAAGSLRQTVGRQYLADTQVSGKYSRPTARRSARPVQR